MLGLVSIISYGFVTVPEWQMFMFSSCLLARSQSASPKWEITTHCCKCFERFFCLQVCACSSMNWQLDVTTGNWNTPSEWQHPQPGAHSSLWNNLVLTPSKSNEASVLAGDCQQRSQYVIFSGSCCDNYSAKLLHWSWGWNIKLWKADTIWVLCHDVVISILT